MVDPTVAVNFSVTFISAPAFTVKLPALAVLSPKITSFTVKRPLLTVAVPLVMLNVSKETFAELNSAKAPFSTLTVNPLLLKTSFVPALSANVKVIPSLIVTIPVVASSTLLGSVMIFDVFHIVVESVNVNGFKFVRKTTFPLSKFNVLTTNSSFKFRVEFPKLTVSTTNLEFMLIVPISSPILPDAPFKTDKDNSSVSFPTRKVTDPRPTEIVPNFVNVPMVASASSDNFSSPLPDKFPFIVMSLVMDRTPVITKERLLPSCLKVFSVTGALMFNVPSVCCNVPSVQFIAELIEKLLVNSKFNVPRPWIEKVDIAFDKAPDVPANVNVLFSLISNCPPIILTSLPFDP